MVLYLVLSHVFLIVVCNYMVQFPLEMGIFTVSWGMFAYPFVVILTDLTTRFMGPLEARKVVMFAWIPAWILSMFMSQPRIACVSILAYALSQFLDISIFSRVRDYCRNQMTKRTGLWILPPFLSAIFSQAFDTYFFYAAAFVGSSDTFMAANWLEIATFDYLFKCLVAVCVLLPLYGLCLRYLLGYMSAHTQHPGKVTISWI